MKGLSILSTILLIFTAASPCHGQNFSTYATVQPKSKSNKQLVIWISICAAVLVVVVVVVTIIMATYRRRIKSALKMVLPLYRRPDQTCTLPNLTASQHLDAINFGPRRFRYAELKVATNNFSEEQLLGRGGFGSVYKGVILESANQNEKITVAIKRMAKNSKQGEREFHSEVLSIGRLRHRNLVSLLGWCHECDELLLVYDFMAKGSLEQHLYHKLGYPTLPWQSRFQILQGITSALDYLHSGWEKCILHRDIKPSNVLLDCHMTARLGDFGLARLAGHTIVSELNPNSRASMGSNVGGTLGYMAPEVFMHGKLTKKADVYSFGMVALEVVCGQRPPGFYSEDEEECLVGFVWSAYLKGQLLDVIDSSLRECSEMNSIAVQQQMTSVLQLGLLCTQLDPALRPPTNRLLQGLNGDLNISLPSSRTGSPSSAMSLFSRSYLRSGSNYAVYFGATNFSYAELQAATEDFSESRVVGKGWYGQVYKGKFTSKQEVAIKRVSPNSRGEEFHAEILTTIGRSRHRNLVSLLGWCYEKGELFLVYEFMENGWLEDFLQPTNGAKPLPWTSRFRILEGIAAALDYLHSGCQQKCILHKDIKPRNVMLDNHMTAKLADFGLQSIAEIKSSKTEVDPYMAPELLISGDDSAASVKSDVYSFGMLALEVVCGRSPHTKGKEDLVPWVRSMHKRGLLWDVIDPALETAFFEKSAASDVDAYAFRNQVDFDFDEVKHRQQMTRVVQLGMSCTLPEPSLRPHSKRLIQALYGDWNMSLPPSYASSESALSSSCSASFEDYHSSATDPLLSNLG
ncbi:hypothetical protein M758_6G031100 [Ceratodon purpureus]|nr:hypothetical protein M758_6G031100 [Ceratodon purpureus]